MVTHHLLYRCTRVCTREMLAWMLQLIVIEVDDSYISNVIFKMTSLRSKHTRVLYVSAISLLQPTNPLATFEEGACMQ